MFLECISTRLPPQNNEELSAEFHSLSAAARAYHKAMQGETLYLDYLYAVENSFEASYVFA